MNISKLSIKQLINLDWEDISKFDVKQSVTYEKRLRKIVSRRLENIKASGLYSHATEQNFPKGLPKVSYSKSVQTIKPGMNIKGIRNESQHNISALKSFLEHESSTVTGIKAARKRQAIRIFGENKRGRPNYQFSSLEEERRFWAAYDEFKNQFPTYSLFSTRIQQFLGEETFWKTRDFGMGDLNSLLVRMQSTEGRVDIRSDPEWMKDLEELL